MSICINPRAPAILDEYCTRFVRASIRVSAVCFDNTTKRKTVNMILFSYALSVRQSIRELSWTTYSFGFFTRSKIIIIRSFRTCKSPRPSPGHHQCEVSAIDDLSTSTRSEILGGENKRVFMHIIFTFR
jgi:hypothetical protein